MDSRQQIRGSSFLLLGRLLSLGLNLLTQVLVVRYLAKAEFGGLAFALAMVEFTSQVSLLGLNKACLRFMPYYQELGDVRRCLGTFWAIAATVFGAATALTLLVVACRNLIADHLASSQLSVSLLLILVALTPLDAIDYVLESFFASFARVRIVFLRRHVLGPGFRLIGVLCVMLLGEGVQLLAGVYLLSGLVGFIFYVFAVRRVLAEEQLPGRISIGELRLAAGPLVRYSLPLLSTHVGFLFQGAFVVLLLEWLAGSVAVAEYRAVLPFARLNTVVLVSFSLLFTNTVTRLLVRDDRTKLNDTYWCTTHWVLLLSFPVFALTVVFARPVTEMLLGADYSAASPVMAALALGFFAETAFGLSGHALRSFACVKQIVAADALTIVTALGLYVLLIPRYGAWGAALAGAGSMVLENLCYLVLARRATGIDTTNVGHAGVYLAVGAAAAVLYAVERMAHPSLFVAILLVLVVWLVLLRGYRRKLAAADTFPEITRLPVVGRWIRAREAAGDESGVSINSTQSVP